MLLYYTVYYHFAVELACMGMVDSWTLILAPATGFLFPRCYSWVPRDLPKVTQAEPPWGGWCHSTLSQTCVVKIHSLKHLTLISSSNQPPVLMVYIHLLLTNMEDLIIIYPKQMMVSSNLILGSAWKCYILCSSGTLDWFVTAHPVQIETIRMMFFHIISKYL